MKYLLLIAMMLSTGCASIVSESDYPVTFSASDNQEYTVKNEKGHTVMKGKGVKTQTLKAGGNFNCMDYVASTPCGDTPVSSGIDGWVFGNIFLGGLIGIVVDPMTGASCTLPEHVKVPDCE